MSWKCHVTVNNRGSVSRNSSRQHTEMGQNELWELRRQHRGKRICNHNEESPRKVHSCWILLAPMSKHHFLPPVGCDIFVRRDTFNKLFLITINFSVVVSWRKTAKIDKADDKAPKRKGEKKEKYPAFYSTVTTYMAGITVGTPRAASTEEAGVFSLNEFMKGAMGCLKTIGYRNFSFVTFWWTLLVLTATGMLPCLMTPGDIFQNSARLISTAYLGSRFTGMWRQPWADHKARVSPNKILVSAHWASAPSKEI